MNPLHIKSLPVRTDTVETRIDEQPLIFVRHAWTNETIDTFGGDTTEDARRAAHIWVLRSSLYDFHDEWIPSENTNHRIIEVTDKGEI